MRLSIFFILLTLSTFGQTIPSTRIVGWENAGYRGNIDPNSLFVDVTTQGIIGDSLTNNAPALNTLIQSACGFRAILYFPAGTYLFNSTINLNDSIALRGASSDSTHFVFNFNGASGNCINLSGSGNSSWYSATDGYQKDNSWITVADSGLLQAGDWAEIRESNGSWDTQPISWADYSVGQLLEITGRSGDTVFLREPIRITYDPSLNIQISRFVPKREVAIECLSYERTDSVSCFCPTINFYHAVDCVVRGVEGKKSISAHVLLDDCSNISINGCRFHDAFEYNGSSMHGYGIALYYHTGQCLIENNILHHLRHSISFQCGANGNVVGYNYSFDPNRSEFPANYGADISMHGHYPYANLFEGNIVQNIQLDQTWGPSGPNNTFFRNRAELYGIFMTSGTANSDNENFVGNEVTSTAFLQGNYTLAGSGHFEYGNNVRGTITPSGTANLPDISYYLNGTPAFWNIAANWPSIGPANSIGSGTIPAKDRFLNSPSKTICNDETDTQTGNNAYLKDRFLIYPNPATTSVHIELPASMDLPVDVRVTDVTGQVIIQALHGNGQKFDLSTNSLPHGIYLISIVHPKGSASQKLLIE